MLSFSLLPIIKRDIAFSIDLMVGVDEMPWSNAKMTRAPSMPPSKITTTLYGRDIVAARCVSHHVSSWNVSGFVVNRF